jgi:hypothetical protein
MTGKRDLHQMLDGEVNKELMESLPPNENGVPAPTIIN